MFEQLGANAPGDFFGRPHAASVSVARSGQLDEFDRLGARRSFAHDEEIYADGDSADCWFKVVSGTVRTCKLMADGRRHIAEFFYAGDCFGLDSRDRAFAAEAVDDVIVMRFNRGATDHLIDKLPALAQSLLNLTLRNLAHAKMRLLLLGRMTASERVASLLLELAERREASRAFDVPMARNDIADYLGLSVETVCRVLSSMRHGGILAIPNRHQIEITDRRALEALIEG